MDMTKHYNMSILSANKSVFTFFCEVDQIALYMISVMLIPYAYALGDGFKVTRKCKNPSVW